MPEEAEDFDIINLPEVAEEDEFTPKIEAEKPIPPEVGLEALRKQLEDEVTRRSEAERRHRDAEDRAARAQNEAFAARSGQYETELQLVEAGITELERTGNILKAGLAEAHAAGDAQRVAEITQEMTETAGKLADLRRGHEIMAQKKPEEPKRQPQGDPVEYLASQLSPKSAAWVRAHPECATDQTMFNKMVAAHNWTTDGTGIKPDTPEYFASLDKLMGFAADAPVEKTAQAQVESPLSSAAQVAQAPVVAPVTRGGSSTKTTVTLTALEREMAENMGMTAVEYAKHKVALQKEGKIGQATTH